MPDSDTQQWWDTRDRKTWPHRIVVMRHANHSNGQISWEGRQQIRDVAGALAEWCRLKETRIASVDGFVVHDSLGGEVVATARIMRYHVQTELGDVQEVEGRRRSTELDSALTPTYLPDSAKVRNPDGTKPEARLVVLNEPQAGWLIKELTGGSLELRRSELVMLERVPRLRPPYRVRRPYRAIWTMAPRAPDGDPLLGAVREKVASKMRTAGLLAGLITALLTFVLTQLSNRNIAWGPAAFVSLIALAVGATLFFVAMFFYDTLTMPPEFWGGRAVRRLEEADSSSDEHRLSEKPRGWYWSASQGWLLERPPSATSRVVQLNMVRVWMWVFRPAVLAIGLGAVFLLIALDRPAGEQDSVDLAATTTPTTTAGTGQAEETSGTETAAPTTNGEPAAATTAVPDDRAEESRVDLTRWHAISLLVTAAGVVAWCYWFRPRTGASD